MRVTSSKSLLFLVEGKRIPTRWRSVREEKQRSGSTFSHTWRLGTRQRLGPKPAAATGHHCHVRLKAGNTAKPSPCFSGKRERVRREHPPFHRLHVGYASRKAPPTTTTTCLGDSTLSPHLRRQQHLRPCPAGNGHGKDRTGAATRVPDALEDETTDSEGREPVWLQASSGRIVVSPGEARRRRRLRTHQRQQRQQEQPRHRRRNRSRGRLHAAVPVPDGGQLRKQQ